MRYVYVKEGIAYEIIPEFNPIFPGIPISQRYAPDFIADCVPVDDSVEVQQGWLRTENGFEKPVEEVIIEPNPEPDPEPDPEP